MFKKLSAVACSMQGKTWKQTCPDSLQQGALSCKTYRCRKQPVELLGFSLSRSPALQKKTALFLIKTCRLPRQKRWFISVPYCPYYSTLVTVLQDFFMRISKISGEFWKKEDSDRTGNCWENGDSRVKSTEIFVFLAQNCRIFWISN